jgi:trans-AT polyketide synthase/acyltransferase/oxidoreductase domain-containing protein
VVSERDLEQAVERHEEPVYVARGGPGCAPSLFLDRGLADGPVDVLPGIHPENLGDPSFKAQHRVRLQYISGEMANGIATVEMVEQAARAGWLGFFGAAGCALDRIEQAMVRLRTECGDTSWGSNLIHSPTEPELEDKTIDLYLRHGVRRVSASAFMAMRPSIVRYTTSGLMQGSDGRPVRSNFLFAKISRPEVARQFLSPPPEPILQALLDKRAITPSEAALARRMPVAEDVTVEADSGGHTDNRPLTALLPAILALRDELQNKHNFPVASRIGAAGSIGTPSAVSAAFAMGAAYVLTGS